MSKRKSPPTIALEVAMEDEGSASEEEVAVISPTGFPPRPTMPQGSKAAKADAVAQKKWERIVQSQMRATETMAEASLRKANAIQDQCVMSLFTMPLEEGMTQEAKKYFTLRRHEEIHRVERRMQVERRQAELEEIDHARLLKERNLDAPPARNRAIAAPVVPVVTPTPPSAPSPTIPESAAAGAGGIPREFTGDQEDSNWEDTGAIPDIQPTAGESQSDPSFGGSQDTRLASPSQCRNFRAGLSVEVPQPEYVCSAPSAFGHTNVMFGLHSAGLSPNQGAFTENHMIGYRNGGPGLNLNAQFY